MGRFEFGEYRTLALLGAGGMGRAYLARSASGRLVVVKVMHAHLAAEPPSRCSGSGCVVRGGRRVP